MNSRTNFLDTDFDTWSRREVHKWLSGRSATSGFAYVVTPNVDHMVRLATAGTDVRLAYANADLCVCDSRVLHRLAEIFGVQLTIVPGSDLVADLFEHLLGDRFGMVYRRLRMFGTLFKVIHRRFDFSRPMVHLAECLVVPGFTVVHQLINMVNRVVNRIFKMFARRGQHILGVLHRTIEVFDLVSNTVEPLLDLIHSRQNTVGLLDDGIELFRFGMRIDLNMGMRCHDEPLC